MPPYCSRNICLGRTQSDVLRSVPPGTRQQCPLFEFLKCSTWNIEAKALAYEEGLNCSTWNIRDVPGDVSPSRRAKDGRFPKQVCLMWILLNSFRSSPRLCFVREH